MTRGARIACIVAAVALVIELFSLGYVERDTSRASGLAAKAKGAASTVTVPASPGVAQMLQHLKLVNYYPHDAGWPLMWTNFPIDEMNHDFAAMHTMGANSVRIILQVSTIGYPTPSTDMLGELSTIVKTAYANGLRTQLTLFDWFDGYRQIADSMRWASIVLAPYKNDPRISFVEIKNEVDVTNAAELAWAKTMLPVVRNEIGTVPLTISLPDYAPDGALATIKSQLGGLIDFFDIHDYGPATSQLAADQALVAPKPLYIGEAGYSTGNGGPSSAAAEAAQATFFSQLNARTKSLHIGVASPWAWQDFAAGSLTWLGPGSSSEYGYGLLRVDGTPKPAFGVEQAAFAG